LRWAGVSQTDKPAHRIESTSKMPARYQEDILKVMRCAQRGFNAFLEGANRTGVFARWVFSAPLIGVGLLASNGKEPSPPAPLPVGEGGREAG
jgi:hypothetical protein